MLSSTFTTRLSPPMERNNRMFESSLLRLFERTMRDPGAKVSIRTSDEVELVVTNGLKDYRITLLRPK